MTTRLKAVPPPTTVGTPLSQLSPAEAEEAGVMLALAMLSYRGYRDLRFGVEHRRRLAAEVESGLSGFDVLQSSGKPRFRLVWGPAYYRQPLTFTDDAAMFVLADDASEGERLIVVVRGTNPVSGPDWFVGNFLVRCRSPWPDGPSDARISSSAGLGLRMLLTMRSEPRERRVAGLFSAAANRAQMPMRAATASMSPRARRAGLGVHLTRRREGALISPADDATALMRYLDRTDCQRRLLKPIDAVGDVAARVACELGAPRLAEVAVAVGTAAAGPRRHGLTLLEVLKELEPKEVVVTGHSKGGALAQVLARHLVDHRGSEPGLDWDPSGEVDVRCAAFAPPTPGNSAFAALVSDMGDACRLYVNPLDIVPHVWATGNGGGPSVEQIKHLYPWAEAVVDDIASDVASLGYAHPVDRLVILEPPPPPPDRNPAAQAIHQHATTYLAEFGLAGELGIEDFFL